MCLVILVKMGLVLCLVAEKMEENLGLLLCNFLDYITIWL
jgi:hypothetical protein